MSKRIGPIYGLAAAAFLAAITAGPVFSQNCLYTPDRYFIRLSTQGASFRGDLDGRLVIGNDTKVFFVPKLSPRYGLGVSFGGMRKSGVWSISFARSVHGTTFQGQRSESSYNSIDVSGLAYLLQGRLVKPYFLLGFNLPWVSVRDGAEKDGVPSNATYLGAGVHTGGGLLVHVSPRVFISGGVMSKFIGLFYVNGPGRSRDVTNLYINRTGPRREIFLRVFEYGLEFSVGFLL